MLSQHKNLDDQIKKLSELSTDLRIDNMHTLYNALFHIISIYPTSLLSSINNGMLKDILKISSNKFNQIDTLRQLYASEVIMNKIFSTLQMMDELKINHGGKMRGQNLSFQGGILVYVVLLGSAKAVFDPRNDFIKKSFLRKPLLIKNNDNSSSISIKDKKRELEELKNDIHYQKSISDFLSNIEFGIEFSIFLYGLYNLAHSIDWMDTLIPNILVLLGAALLYCSVRSKSIEKIMEEYTSFQANIEQQLEIEQDVKKKLSIALNHTSTSKKIHTRIFKNDDYHTPSNKNLTQADDDNASYVTSNLILFGSFENRKKINNIVKKEKKAAEKIVDKITVTEKPVITYFDGLTLKAKDHENVFIKEIDGTPSFIILYKNIDATQDDLFKEYFKPNNRLSFHSDRISKLSQFEGAIIKFQANGIEIEAKVTHELKHINTDDRIAVASFPCDIESGCDAKLYIAFRYIENGFHHKNKRKNFIDSLKHMKTVNLDFLFEKSLQKKLEDPQKLKKVRMG